ncbi:hypothetical protein AYK26_03080 [Euryarchaeota archaeon SM23-78]|nr:MAG: hypothetical protein AYK26_03080 [Euryarchaeota archaeon SM23-78]MBW3000428.1 hypothetical protein [Candidatus Woesearchaeota archaeon]
MSDPIRETKKRLLLAEHELEKFRNISLGAILAGSVAYSPNLNVTEKSDVDLVIIVKKLKPIIPILIEYKVEQDALQKRFFEGYCIKKEKEGVPISTHVLSEDSFDIISKCFVANIRVYRQGEKTGVYELKGFEGNTYSYKIKNIPLADLPGVRTIVPISFIHRDRYYIGIHRDKLLSNPIILYEKDEFVSRKIEKLWKMVAENLYDESMRLYSDIDISKMNILNALSKKEKMSPKVIETIKDKTNFYLSKIK